MISASWFLYCTAVALLLYIAGLTGEAALRAAGRSVRWVWAAVVAGTLLVPVAAWSGLLRRVFPVPATGSGQEPALTEAATPPAVGEFAVLSTAVVEEVAGGLPQLVEWLAALSGPAFTIAWLLFSTLSFGAVLVAIVRLRRLRTGWRGEVVDGIPVFVSRRVGPAVVDIVSGSIVVPQWALALEQRLRRLMLRHEREHLLAGDPRLNAFGLAALILMPWNVPLWWQVRRLRAAVELDCDARVLRAEPDPRGYGTLLLEVGRRRSGLGPLVVGLAEPPSALERRIRMLTRHGGEPRVRTALALGAVAGLVALGSCWVGEPTDPETQAGPEASSSFGGGSGELRTLQAEPFDRGVVADADRVERSEDAVTAAEVEAARQAAAALAGPNASCLHLGGAEWKCTPRQGIPSEPTFTPMTVHPQLRDPSAVLQTIQAAYPPAFLDAGIGGRTVYWLYIDDNGAARDWSVHTSSGYEELDLILPAILDHMEFTPAMNREQAVAVWIELPITWNPDRAAMPRWTAPAQTVGQPPATRQDAVVPTTAGSGTSMGGTPAAAAIAVAQTEVAQDRANHDISAAPTFTPMTVRPQLRNPEAVQRALREAYPPFLRDAGIGGIVGGPSDLADRVLPTVDSLLTGPAVTRVTTTPRLINADELQRAIRDGYPARLRYAGVQAKAVYWLLIDEMGQVVRTDLHTSSGYAELDAFGLQALRRAEFVPARDETRAVPVWVELPVAFAAG